MLPKLEASRSAIVRRLFALFFCLMLLLLPTLPTARAVEAPPLGPLTYIQTNGPNSDIALGDWYTNTANGSVPGYHYLKINVPCGWPAATPVYVDLFSPEMNSNAPLSDEIMGPADDTQFELYLPGTAIGPLPDLPAPGAGIPTTQVTYTPSIAPETWVRYASFTPTLATCGSYILRAQTFNDDENGWRLRVGTDNDADPTNAPPANSDNPDGIAGTNDEITIGTTQTTYQHDQTVPPAALVDQCLTLYEYLAPGQPTVTFHNFDMDANQRVSYYSPTDAYDPTAMTGGTVGTVSGFSEWNGGTQTSRGSGDTIANPVAGWWRIVTCVDNHNQYIQEGQLNVPAYYTQPPTPVMTLAKDDGRTIVSLNDLLTYTITFANTSNATPTPGAATNLVLRDTLPANTTYQSCAISAPFSGTCSQAAGVVTFALTQAVSAGASGSVQVTVQVNSNAAGKIDNAAQLDYQDGSGNSFPPVSASDSDTLAPIDLSIVKSDGGVTTAPGGGALYTLSYTNAGALAATGVVITENVPANTTFDAAGSTAGWSCADGAPAGTSCTFALGSVATGVSGAVAFAVKVDNPLPVGVTQITNSASIGDDGTHGADPTPANNGSSDNTPISAAPDLRLTKRANTLTATPGAVIGYTLAFTNSGTIGATSVVITETVPPNTTYNAAASGATIWSCANGSLPGTICTTAIPGVVAGAGGSGAVSFGLTVDTPLPAGVTAIVNTAVIADNAANGPDPTPINNSGSASTSLPPTAITLASFTATRDEQGVVVRWETTAELNTWGFLLYRSADGTRASAVQITPQIIAGQGRGQGGASYRWHDAGAAQGVTYRYWLVEVETAGGQTAYGPATAGAHPAQATGGVFLPLIAR